MDNDKRASSRDTSGPQAAKPARLLRFTVRPTRKQTKETLALLGDPVVEVIRQASIPPLTGNDRPRDEIDLAADIVAPMLADVQAEQRERERIANIDQDPHPDILPR